MLIESACSVDRVEEALSALLPMLPEIHYFRFNPGEIFFFFLFGCFMFHVIQHVHVYSLAFISKKEINKAMVNCHLQVNGLVFFV